MNKTQILAAIKSLGKSQGFYSRLYTDLMYAPEADRDNYLQNLEDEKFEDELEMVMYLESNNF